MGGGEGYVELELELDQLTFSLHGMAWYGESWSGCGCEGGRQKR